MLGAFGVEQGSRGFFFRTQLYHHLQIDELLLGRTEWK
tara:strand:+ start:143 stop:256 length:114 start_codon:yes stop_codon:yes gene_type:complete